MINITFPDQSVRQYESGVTPLDIAMSLSEGLARNVLAANVNGMKWDATRPINEDATIQLFTWNDPEGKAAMWHSSAHLMAAAIEALYPGVKFGIGPSVDNGFYYDIDTGDITLTEADLANIEKKMLELAREKETFERIEVSKADALKYFKASALLTSTRSKVCFSRANSSIFFSMLTRSASVKVMSPVSMS